MACGKGFGKAHWGKSSNTKDVGVHLILHLGSHTSEEPHKDTDPQGAHLSDAGEKLPESSKDGEPWQLTAQPASEGAHDENN